MNLIGFQAGIVEMKTVVFNNLTEMPPDPKLPIKEKLKSLGAKSILYAGLSTHNELLGYMAFVSDLPDFFHEAHQIIAEEIAQQLSIALEQIRLIDTIKRNNEELEARVLERTTHFRSNQNWRLCHIPWHMIEISLRTIAGFSTF